MHVSARFLDQRHIWGPHLYEVQQCVALRCTTIVSHSLVISSPTPCRLTLFETSNKSFLIFTHTCRMISTTFPFAIPLFFAYLSFVSAQDSTCYWRSQNAIAPVDGWFACHNTQQQEGGAQLCCLDGSQCSDDALCRQSSGSGGYNYFVGGCTDPNYQDDVCRSSCSESQCG